MSNRVEEFNETIDKMLNIKRDNSKANVTDQLTKLSILMESMREHELISVYMRNNKEYQTLVSAAKLLPQNHPNRRYIIKLYMNKYLDMMIMQNKNIKRALDNGELDAEELLKEMDTYNELNEREDYITAGEESFRRRKKIQGKTVYKVDTIKLKNTEKKLVNNINSIGSKTNKTRNKLVNNINNLKYNK